MTMKNMYIKPLLISVFLLVLSCEKEKSDLPIELEFHLLDENGVPSTVFQEGLNFRFCFIIRNKSSEDIGYIPDFINDDFFRVYRIDSSEGVVSKGKPYENFFCEYSGTHFIVPSGDERRLEIPWIPSEDFCCSPFCIVNPSIVALPKGKYKTFIEGPFNFMYKDKPLSINDRFEIVFEIQ